MFQVSPATQWQERESDPEEFRTYNKKSADDPRRHRWKTIMKSRNYTRDGDKHATRMISCHEMSSQSQSPQAVRYDF